MRGRKGDKQPGNTQGHSGAEGHKEAEAQSCKAKSKPASSLEQEADLYLKGRPQEMSGGMSK